MEEEVWLSEIAEVENVSLGGTGGENWTMIADLPAATFYDWVLVILSALVFLGGLMGNALVWFAVWRNPRMRSATNVLLVNLAVADFLVLLVCLPPTVSADLTGNWKLGLHLCKAIHYLQKVTVFVSVLTLTSISLERWLAVCRPLSPKRCGLGARCVLLALWGAACLAALPDLITFTTETHAHYTHCRPGWSDQEERVSLVVTFVVFYVAPLVVMATAYVHIAIVLWRSGSIQDHSETTAHVPRAQLLVRRKKAKMLIVVVALFAICYLPVYTLFILGYTGQLWHLSPATARTLAMGAHWMCYFNSAINPAIYNFMSCNFRREFRLACRLCCRRSEEGSFHFCPGGRGSTSYRYTRRYPAVYVPYSNHSSLSVFSQHHFLSHSTSQHSRRPCPPALTSPHRPYTPEDSDLPPDTMELSLTSVTTRPVPSPTPSA